MGNSSGKVEASGPGAIAIGGDNTGIANTGSGNTFIKTTLPPAESVDIGAELAALRAALLALGGADAGKIERALEDAAEEAVKPEPDKAEVAGALDRAIAYAEKAEGFAGTVEKLVPRVRAIAGWLGEHGPKLLRYVGLSL